MKNYAEFMWLIMAGAFFYPSLSYSQNLPVPPVKVKQLHHETLGDQYLPNVHNNKKISPGYKYVITGSSEFTTSSIFTTQVNVDFSGQNIIGDAANEPNIAVNPLNGNYMVIGWRQFDNVASNFRQAGWSYTADSGQTWTFPGVIEPGIFRSDPVLDYDTSGNFYYNSLTYNSVTSNFNCKVFQSANGGVSWDNGVDAFGGDKQWMTVDKTTGIGSGNIYSFWTSYYSSCLPGFFTRSSNGGGSYENCTIVDGYPFWGTMAVGNIGELYIAGADSNSNIVVAKSVNVQVPDSLFNWEMPVSVFMDGYITWPAVNPQGLIGQVNIDVDRSNGPGQGNVYVLAPLERISNFDPGDVMFSKSTDGGLSWGSPIKINDDSSETNTQWFGTMSVAPNGRIDAIWLDTRDDPSGLDSSALYYSFSTDQGNTWSANEKLSPAFDPHAGYPNQNKMGDYFDMVSDNSGAHLAWANTLNGEEDVYYSHIIPPITTGTGEIYDNASISIYPNPADGVFVITAGVTPSRIEIYSTLGIKVYTNTNLTVENKIDISSQPAGFYFVKIFDKDGSTAIGKIIR